MKQNNIIEDLNSRGCTISVRHKRKYVKQFCSLNDGTKLLKYVKSPNGGQTLVTIMTPDSYEFSAKAKCCKIDKFHGTVGFDIALGRAYKLFASSVFYNFCESDVKV